MSRLIFRPFSIKSYTLILTGQTFGKLIGHYGSNAVDTE